MGNPVSELWNSLKSPSLAEFSRPWGTIRTTSSNKAVADTQWVKTIVLILSRIYWIVGLILIVGLSYVLFNTYNRQVAGVLIFLGGILALYFYYVKWFVIDIEKAKSGFSLCPDYLTPISPGLRDGQPDKNGSFRCVDFVGVSSNGILKKSTPSTVAKDVTIPGYYIELNQGMSASQIQGILDQYGLTWISMFGYKD